ncbi:MAG: hypothetical protein WC704_03610 [Sphingomonas sp.]
MAIAFVRKLPTGKLPALASAAFARSIAFTGSPSIAAFASAISASYCTVACPVPSAFAEGTDRHIPATASSSVENARKIICLIKRIVAKDRLNPG